VRQAKARAAGIIRQLFAAMEAERVNQIASKLAGLSARAAELRRYL
jgi:hypothetical protein